MNNNNKEKIINIISAITEITILLPISYPLDVLKNRLQIDYYRNYKHFFNLLYKYEHNKNLYRGFIFLYTDLIIKHPIKMSIFEHIQSPIYGGIYASFITLIISTPFSFIKTNYQVNDKFKFNYSTKNIFKVWNYEFIKDMLGTIIFFSFYGFLRKNNNLLDNINTLNFINGTIASTITTFITYPIDIIKVRKQTIQQNYNFKQIFNNIAYNNNKFNIYNFWKGYTPIFIRTTIFGGFGMFIYEKCKIKLNNNFML